MPASGKESTDLPENPKTKNVINVAILHKIEKERHGSPAVITRSESLPLTQPVMRLVDDIYSLYNSKTGKGYGRFEADETNFPVARILRETYRDEKKTFVEASKELVNVLAARAGQAQLATGGYVIMADGSNPNKGSWFLVGIITNVRASAIKEESLEIVDAIHIDLQNLRVAGRVSLTDWLDEKKEVRYIGFLKQRGEVSDYFKLFLGCNEFIQSTEETKKLVRFLKDFAKRSGLDDEKQQVFLKSAHDYCHERSKSDTPLSLDALSNAIWPENPKVLQESLAADGVEISDGFIPDGRSLKGFLKIKARTPYWAVELDRLAIVKGQAKYDAEKETLTLTDLPEELKRELSTELQNNG